MSDLPSSWQAILQDAIAKPGSIHDAYTRFHNYSVGNQLLAMFQCAARGLQPGPIATFVRWKELGRHVRKGEKALTLCMPVTCKAKHPTRDDHGNDTEQETTFTRFVYRNNWFVLAQTEGAEYKPEPLPDWDESRALATLAIERIGFDDLDGNTQGYATARQVAINSLAAMPLKTLFHELAHVMLGHTAEGNLNDGNERTPRSLREVEAECVALLCCESLGLPGAEFSRGYIQAWGSEIPERSAQKIFHAADLILKAGTGVNHA
jgi:antirestriction protein ArdC